MPSDISQPGDQERSSTVALGAETDREVDVIILFISDEEVTFIRYAKW